MEYFLIKGYYHVVGHSPDGDSLKFEAENPKDWENLQSQFSELFKEKLEEHNGVVQLRLQGIDALETHYSPTHFPPPAEVRGKEYEKAEKPKARKFRQPAEIGDLATKKLLSYLGVKSINWGNYFGNTYIKDITAIKDGSLQTISEKGQDRLKGYIIVNDYDRKGRPISWVFGGAIEMESGSRISTSYLEASLKQSTNYRLVATGLVYPYFFMTLSAVLRQRIIWGLLNAQRQKMGLWAVDQSHVGMKLNRISQLKEDYLIFPYLFRRMIKHQFKCLLKEYWEAVAKKKSYKPDQEALFLESFFEETNPYIFLVNERDFVRLDDIVKISENTIQLKAHPGNIVFLQ